MDTNEISRIFNFNQSAKQIKRSFRPWSQRLTLGVIPTIGPYLIPWLLEPVKYQLNQVSWQIEEADNAVLLEQLRQGTIDAALVGDSVDEPDLESRHLFNEPFYFILPSQAPVAAYTEPVPLEVAAGSRLLLLEANHRLHHQVRAIANQAGITEEGMKAANIETLRFLVAAGNGVTLLPQMCIDKGCQVPGTVAKRVASDQVSRGVYLVWRNHCTQAPLYEAAGRLIALQWQAAAAVWHNADSLALEAG